MLKNLRYGIKWANIWKFGEKKILTFKKFKPNEPKYVDRNIQNVFETTWRYRNAQTMWKFVLHWKLEN